MGKPICIVGNAVEEIQWPDADDISWLFLFTAEFEHEGLICHVAKTVAKMLFYGSKMHK